MTERKRSWYRDIFRPWIRIMAVVGGTLGGVLAAVIMLLWGMTLLWR